MFRRDLGLFAKCLTSALLSFAVLVVICAVAVFAIISSGEEPYIEPTVALVNNEDSELSEFVIGIVGNIDYISETIKLEEMSEEEAVAALADGRCAAVIILPNGFTGDILHGREAQGRIIISEAISAQAEIVCEIAKFGETLLGAGQYGVFSGEKIISENSLWSDHEDYITTSNLKLLGEAFGAGQHYIDVEITGYADTGIPQSSYYLLCWSVGLLFLVSLFFGELFTADMNRPLLSRLYACGITKAHFMKWKLILTFAFRLVIAAVMFAVIDGLGLAELSLAIIPLATVTAAYITVVSACLSVCLGDGITSHVLSSVGGLLLCGGIVPRQILPHFLCRIGDLTPFGAAKAIIAPAFGAPVDWPGIIAAVIYTAIAAVAMYYKLRRVPEGRAVV